MKGMLAVAALALALQLAAPAAAEEPVATHLGDDAAGDVRADAQGQGTTTPGDSFAPVDLKALDAVETPDSIVFILTVASLAPQAEGPIQGSTQYQIHMEQNDRMYRVRIQRQVFAEAVYSARLDGFDPGRGGYYTVDRLDVVADISTGTLTVTVPRQLLLDANGSAPHPEAPMHGFRVVAHGMSSAALRPRGLADLETSVRDALPDTGNLTVELPIKFGARQSGMARLSSPVPTRASNGEATTFVYQVIAQNLGTREDTYALSTGPIPKGWDVKLPAAQVTIPGNGTVQLPVIVSTPFAHTHGAFQNFILEMRSLDDPQSVGAVQLGVRYSQPPQPAGHHSTLYFHSAAESEDPATQALLQAFGAGVQVYMNAAETDPTDQGVDVPAQNWGTSFESPPRQLYRWEVPLAPALEMGLDFDVAKKGELTLNIRSPLPLQDAMVSGSLVHLGSPVPTQPGMSPTDLEGQATVLADMVATALSGEQVVLEVTPRAAADFVPFQKDASLVLWLNLTTTRPSPPFATGHADPVLVPGSMLTLPLLEYHDPVDDIFVSDVELVVDSRQDRTVAPGQTVLYNLTLHNRGASDGTFLLDMDGINLAWARLLPPQSVVPVGAGGSHSFSVVVSVPADVAVPKEMSQPRPAADLIVSAVRQGEPGQRSLARLYTSVDNGDFPDDAALVEALEDRVNANAATPGFGTLLALAAVAAGLLASRRR